MLTNSNIAKITKNNKIVILAPQKIAVIPTVVNIQFFYPEKKDALFWCFYIIKYGFSMYEFPGNTSFINEKKEKFKCIELLRLNSHILKSKKIKNIKEDIEDDLANKEIIGIKTFIALCSIEKINVLYIHNKKYYDMNNDPESANYYVIHNTYLNKYCYETDLTNEQINKYKSTLFKCENILKPLNAISYYKASELLDFCKQINLDMNTTTKKTKQELYDLLILYL
jgi:hypothetical protein